MGNQEARELERAFGHDVEQARTQIRREQESLTSAKLRALIASGYADAKESEFHQLITQCQILNAQRVNDRHAYCAMKKRRDDLVYATVILAVIAAIGWVQYFIR